MSKESMVGYETGNEIMRLCRRVMSNRAFITKEDMKVLEFLGNKGEYDDKKVGIVDNYPDNMEEAYDLFKETPEYQYNPYKKIPQLFQEWIDKNYTLVKNV